VERLISGGNVSLIVEPEDLMQLAKSMLGFLAS
jgi:hypothetical protein